MELWNSEYDVKGGVLECSSALTIVSTNTFNKPIDLVEQYVFYNFKHRKLSGYSHHLFQFQVWKKSMQSKFIMEGIFLFILTIVFMYFLLEAIDSGHELLTVYNAAVAANSTQAAIDTALEEHHTAAETFQKDMEITEYLSIVAFFYPLRIVLEMLFAAKRGRGLNFLTLTNLLDVTISICFLIRLIKEHAAYREGLDEQPTSGKEAVRYFENIYEFENDEILLDVLYSIAVGCLWVRILYMFRLTRFLGPLLKMIYNMLWDILIFMVLFTIVLIIYASVGTFLFYTVSSYKDFYTAIVSLFGSTLGGFTINELDNQNKGKIVGDIYIVSFLILSNILILNLLIAILSSTYAALEEKKLVLYINEILKLRSSLQYNKHASGLVSTFPPWNFFPLVFAPFYFIKKDSRKLNNVVFHITYIPVAFLLALVFLIAHVILIPFAYCKGILIKFQFLCDKKSERPMKWRVITLLVWLPFGLFI